MTSLSYSNPQAGFMLIMPTANDAPIFAIPENASAAISTLQELRFQRMFRLFGYAVLPNQLRVVLQPEPGRTLKDVLRSLRGGVGRAVGKQGFQGPVWMPRSEITKIWNRELLKERVLEVESAPVSLGIAANPESFLFSSAHADAEIDALDALEPQRAVAGMAVAA